jgi:hypothetical protein
VGRRAAATVPDRIVGAPRPAHDGLGSGGRAARVHAGAGRDVGLGPGAAIVASTEELARQGSGPFRALSHQGQAQGLFLSAFAVPRARWIVLVVYDSDSSLGLVQLFFDQLVRDLRAAAPDGEAPREVLAADFETELNASLRSLFGR